MSERLTSFLESRPRLAVKYAYPGSFKEYAADLATRVTPRSSLDTLSRTIIREAKRILGDEVDAAALERQLLTRPLLSTADHHALLVYDLLYNSNLLHSLVSTGLDLPYNVVLPTGSIPLCNRAFPRGFRFNGRKFNFFSHKHQNILVHLFAGRLEPERGLGLDSLVPNAAKGVPGAQERRFLEHLFFEGLQVERSAGMDSYSDQLTFLNFRLWKLYFERSLRERVPDLLYLQSNRIIEEALVAELEDGGSLLSLMLFDPEVREMYLERFRGIQGCWSADRGSHFFWGISHRNTRVSLRVRDGELQGEGFSLPLQRDAVISALRDQRILPVVFVDLLLITFLSGQVNLGGFNQVEYLPEMQATHVRCLCELGLDGLAEEFASRYCEAFICGLFPFNLPSGLDLIWQRNSAHGRFLGALDRGITAEELETIEDTTVRELMEASVDSMIRNS